MPNNKKNTIDGRWCLETKRKLKKLILANFNKSDLRLVRKPSIFKKKLSKRTVLNHYENLY